MKALLLPLAACAVLAGCATYGDPYYGHAYPAGAYPGGAVVQTYPSYGAGAVYQTHQYGGVTYSNSYPVYQTDPYARQYRDRDRDGIPNRMDNDRDGDGVPNAYDAYPGDPRRR